MDFNSGGPAQIPALAAFACSFMGWLLYVPVARSVALRRSMYPLWLCHGLGGVLGLGAAAAALLAGGPALSALGLSALAGATISVASWIAVYRWMMHVPSGTRRPKVGQPLADFTILDEHRRPFRPADYIDRGPLLLVFFRGYW